MSNISHAAAVICGAGIAGIAAAHFLAGPDMRGVVLVDERRPLTLTSDKSTEAYRNWWPGPDDAMLRFMNRSIDLLEELAWATRNAFHLNRRGYFYCTADPAHAGRLRAAAELAAAQGAGTLRVHDGGPGAPRYMAAPNSGWRADDSVPVDGADLITDRALLREHFGWLADDTVAVLHARRCGWFSGQILGTEMLDYARAEWGAQLVPGRVVGVETAGGRVSGVRVAQDGREILIETPVFVNAAGPFARAVGRMAGADLPLFSERHLKIAFDDSLRAVPRTTGLVICDDPIRLDWDDDERAELAAADETRWLTEALPAGAHLRPEGHGPAQTVLLLWPYHSQPVAETFPVALDPDFTEVVLRGMARLIPGLRPYTRRLPKVSMDGGYYTKTRENRPLIGPLPLPGAYVLAGLSGFGLMAACAAGELLAAHVLGDPLPEYAPAFLPSRYDDPAYRAKVDAWGGTGQL